MGDGNVGSNPTLSNHESGVTCRPARGLRGATDKGLACGLAGVKKNRPSSGGCGKL